MIFLGKILSSSLNLHVNKNILQKIADTSLIRNSLSFNGKPIKISEVMRTSLDRPKVTAVQNTLGGVFQTSSGLKNQQRHKKFKTWGGIQIPVNNNSGVFNRNKDVLNKWDEQRDGIFYQL